MKTFIIFLNFVTGIICISHTESQKQLNSTSTGRQATKTSKSTVSKSGDYPHYVQAPFDYLRNFDDLLTRSSIKELSSDATQMDPNFLDLQTPSKQITPKPLHHVSLYKLSPYQDPLEFYNDHEAESLSLKKHDFARGGQGNFGGWDSYSGGYNLGGHAGGGLRGREAKALFILMAPLILLAVFGPFLATQAMLPWMIGGGMTTVSTIAGGRRKRSTQDFERRLQLFLEVQDYLAKSGNPDLVREMGDAFLNCQKYTERRNKCLERVSCEYTDPSSDLNREERRIGRMVLRSVLANPIVPVSLVNRLQKGFAHAREQSGRCYNYWCEVIDGTKAKH